MTALFDWLDAGGGDLFAFVLGAALAVARLYLVARPGGRPGVGGRSR